MVVEIQCPVFHPTTKDLAGSFEEYISRIERGFSKAGICKIVPPKNWVPRRKGYEGLDFEIPRPITQHATGRQGLYRTVLVEGRPMSLRQDFEPLATSPACQPPANCSDETLERQFWKNVVLRPPLYGADVPGSLFDEDLKGWNMRHLDSLLSRVLEQRGLAIPGVNTPYLYVGMWRSIFAWHTEDLDLHSINYLHYGAPKAWYCIPPAYRARFELVVKGLLPELFRGCSEFLRHKDLLLSPAVLRDHNIPVVRVIQRPGEFVVNFPGAYHSGFNHGYNCAESTNFATRNWIAIGACARFCVCHNDSVRIDMSLFLSEAPPRARKAIRDNMSESESESESEDSSSEEEEAEEARPAKRRKGQLGKALVAGGRSMAAVSGGRAMAAKAGAKAAPAPARRGRPAKALAAKAAPARPRGAGDLPGSGPAAAASRAGKAAAVAKPGGVARKRAGAPAQPKTAAAAACQAVKRVSRPPKSPAVSRARPQEPAGRAGGGLQPGKEPAVRSRRGQAAGSRVPEPSQQAKRAAGQPGLSKAAPCPPPTEPGERVRRGLRPLSALSRMLQLKVKGKRTHIGRPRGVLPTYTLPLHCAPPAGMHQSDAAQKRALRAAATAARLAARAAQAGAAPGISSPLAAGTGGQAGGAAARSAAPATPAALSAALSLSSADSSASGHLRAGRQLRRGVSSRGSLAAHHLAA